MSTWGRITGAPDACRCCIMRWRRARDLLLPFDAISPKHLISPPPFQLPRFDRRYNGYNVVITRKFARIPLRANDEGSAFAFWASLARRAE